jgi:predicted enzyme related to lactoylglutathione lyase
MSGEISFFEIGTGDAEKARTFYGGLFEDWTFETGPSGDGFVVGTGGVPGGIHTGDAGAAMYAFFAVDDLDAAVAQVEALGGEVKPLPDSEENVTEFGRFALCKDDQGSAFGLHQPPAA